MSILNDPSLILGKRPAREATTTAAQVRYRAGSGQAADLRIPAGAVGTVTCTYDQNGERRANIDFGPAGFVTGALMAELEAILCP